MLELRNTALYIVWKGSFPNFFQNRGEAQLTTEAIVKERVPFIQVLLKLGSHWLVQG